MPKASANVSRGPEVKASTASSVLRDAPVVIHQLPVTRVHLKKHRWIVKILVEDGQVIVEVNRWKCNN